MDFKQKIIQRHKNPIGLVLRLLTYIGLAISLWFHLIYLIVILVFVDILNWFFMPMVKPEKEIGFVRRIVQAEIAWIKSPWGFKKIVSIGIGAVLFLTLGIGLWNHDWKLLILAFVLIVILKQLMLKTTATNEA